MWQWDLIRIEQVIVNLNRKRGTGLVGTQRQPQS